MSCSVLLVGHWEPVKNSVMRFLHGCLSGTGCKCPAANGIVTASSLAS